MPNSPNPEPDTYDDAFRDLMARRRRPGIGAALKRADPRPTSPSQVLLLGLALAVVGWLFPVVHLAMLVGITLLVVGVVTGLMQPHSRRVVWRGRAIDLPADETWATRLYRALYRSS